nr:amidohydrolase [Veillonella rogosae]
MSLYIYTITQNCLDEHKAVKVINQFLETHNFTSQVGLTDLPELQTALRGDYNGSAQHKIAFLGEYDALPELGHGCGHNLIAMMSLGGAAIAFSQSAPEAWGGTTFFGCPAEETIGGKVYMAEADLFKGYEAALIIHPGSENEVGGTSLATHPPLEVTFHGRSCHIASLTDSGINALDCAVDLYQRVKELKKTFPKGAIVGAIFTEAGTAPNVVTPKATLRMTVRGRTVDDLEGIILPAIKAAAQEIAASYGAQVEMHHYEPLFKDMRQDKKLLDLFKDVMTEFGETPRILPDDEADGSTDVGNVSYEVPTAQPTLQIGLGLEAHTPEFTCAAGSDYGLAQAIKGAKIMAVVALRYVLCK